MTISCDVTASRVISRANILRPCMDCYHGDEHRNSYYKMERFEKIVSTGPCQFSGHESFQLQLNLKNKVLPFFFRFSLHNQLSEAFTAFSLLLPQLFIFLIFSRQTRLSSSVRPPGLGHGTRPQQQPTRSVPDQTTTPDNRSCLRSDNRSDHAPTPSTRPFSDQTTKISPSDQTTTATPDQQIRSAQQTTILDCSTSNQHRTPNLVKSYRSGAWFVGWVKGGIQCSG